MKNKKALFAISSIILIFIVILAYFFIFAKQSQAVGNLQIYDGTAEVIRQEKISQGETGTEIALNDTIIVAPNSRAAIVLKEGTIIRLKDGTRIEVAELTYEGEKLKDVHFKLTSGQAWSRVKPLEKNSQFEVETPAVTASVRGTSFNTTLENDKTGVFVSTHSVDVSLKGTNSKHLITDKRILWIENDNLEEDFAKGPVPPGEDFFEDDWIMFNLIEDAKLCKELHDIPGCEESITIPSGEPTESPDINESSGIPTITQAVTQTPTDNPTPTQIPTNTTMPTKQQPTLTPTLSPTLRITPTPTEHIIY